MKIRLIGWFLAATLTGCASTPSSSKLPSYTSLAEDLQPLSPAARIARMQRGDGLPPRTVAPPAVSPPPGGITTTSLPIGESTATVRVRINGAPLFDSEIINMIGAELKGLGGAPDRAEKQAKMFVQARDFLIDQEVVYQEAVNKLSKGNPKALQKIKDYADLETDKRLQKQLELAAEQGVKIPPEILREMLPMMKRQIERNIVYQEYMRTKIKGIAEARVGLKEVREYYDTHKNEFTKIESVEWQDVFLALGPKYPTLADARRAAEELIAQVRTADDFVKLVPFDDGYSKLSGGKGLGARRGEIKPQELEEYLFNMRDGEIGPVVELSTGVHIFRLVKRDRGGLMPLNEDIQKRIREKLLNQVYDREAKRIIREIRGRSIIEIEGS